MTSLRNFLLVTFLSAVFAFTPSAHSVQRQKSLSSSALFGLAPPEVITKTETVTKSKQSVKKTQKESFKVYEGEPETESKEQPLWMVFLIGDEGYSQSHVTSRLVQIIEDMNDKNALAVYEAAQRVGEALCGKYDMEIAEFYAEQLTRSEPIIFAEIREDKDKDD